MLFQSWASVADDGLTLKQHRVNVSFCLVGGRRGRCHTHPSKHIDLRLDQCWASVVDDGPSLVQHWANVAFLPRCVTRAQKHSKRRIYNLLLSAKYNKRLPQEKEPRQEMKKIDSQRIGKGFSANTYKMLPSG